MKIGIIGTRGIPNEYGGFEQFAMFFSEHLVQQGHEVVVYNSSNHSYRKKEWKGVQLVSIFDPEKRIGTAGQFIYDFLSIWNARGQNFDVIFQLGYTSSSIWGFLFPQKARLITNMDGLEWKRSKYSTLIQQFLKKAEKWAVKQSDDLIADSRGIQEYLKKRYDAESHFIPYGANVVTDFDEAHLENYGILKNEYNIVIARFEPENNVLPIVDAHSKMPSEHLVVIGKTTTKYGRLLVEKYNDFANIHFLGGIYDKEILDTLRFYSQFYFHGHSVGGTNPSLLEAMACRCKVIAHKNEFNTSVIGTDGYYFEDANDLSVLLRDKPSFRKGQIQNNLDKLKSTYSFDAVHHSLDQLISSI